MKADDENRKALGNIILSVLTMVFLVCIIFVYYRMLYSETMENILNKGRVNAIESSDQIDMRMAASFDTLKLAAYTLDSMIKEDRTQDEILDYLTTETAAVEDSLIADTTGLYGYIRGEYMDGSGWVPEEGYDPISRPWYTEAMDGDGELVIVDPYIDLETGKTMISLAKTLCDGSSVVSIDISMSDIQAITEEHVAAERSYAEFIINSRGLVIAHSNRLLIGKNMASNIDPITDMISKRIDASPENSFYLEQNDRDYIVYIMPLENDWKCVSVIDATADFGKLRQPLLVTILTALVMGGAMVFFMVRSEKTSRRAREATISTERAMAASEAKTSFISSMSHEIRTPINAILGMNEMILREETDETIISYSEMIKNAGTTLLAIINDVLDFSKIEAGKIEIIPVDYDLVSLVNDLVSMIKGRVADKGLDLIVNIDKQTPHLLYGDELRIKQIMTNILTNAVKYTEKGSVTLDVSHEMIPGQDDHMMLKVSVTDTGIGIKEEDIRKLFSKYERIEEERNRNVEGTGLGMNITKSLLELMGSSLEVESVYGEGSTFSFAVKQKVRDPEPVGDHETPVGNSLRKSTGYRVKFTAADARILVVDDTQMNLRVFENLIKKTLITIDKAEDGYKAVDMSANTKYDMLFIDHLMPGKDGIETLHDIKAMEGNPNVHTPAICLTANAVSGARQEYIEAGFDDYLMKPIDSIKLEEMLFGYLPPHTLTVSFGTDENTSVLTGIYEKMKDAAKHFDCGRLDDALEELKGNDSKDGPLFKALRDAVERFDYDEVVRLLDNRS